METKVKVPYTIQSWWLEQNKCNHRSKQTNKFILISHKFGNDEWTRCLRCGKTWVNKKESLNGFLPCTKCKKCSLEKYETCWHCTNCDYRSCEEHKQSKGLATEAPKETSILITETSRRIKDE